MKTKEIRVFIADDHPVLRSGIKAVFSGKCSVVGEAEDGTKVVEEVKRLRPDVVIMDIVLPGVDGIEVTRRIKEEAPEVKVIIFSMHQNQHYAVESLKAGASGYVLKGADAGELVLAVEKVLSGGRHISPSVADSLLSDYVIREKVEDPFDTLTGREKEILKLIADGLRAKAMAETLGISVSTVKKYRNNLLKKLKASSTADLIKIAISKSLTKSNI